MSEDKFIDKLKHYRFTVGIVVYFMIVLPAVIFGPGLWFTFIFIAIGIAVQEIIFLKLRPKPGDKHYISHFHILKKCVICGNRIKHGEPKEWVERYDDNVATGSSGYIFSGGYDYKKISIGDRVYTHTACMKISALEDRLKTLEDSGNFVSFKALEKYIKEKINEGMTSNW
jgi:hypothetical protein